MPSLDLMLLNRLSDIGRGADLVEEFCRAHGVPGDATHQLNLALEEILANIVHYAFDKGTDHQIAVTIGLEGNRLEAVVTDDGLAFDPRQAPQPDLDADLDSRSIGGLGLFLVMRMMDGVEYSRVDGRNRIVLCKTLTPDA